MAKVDRGSDEFGAFLEHLVVEALLRGLISPKGARVFHVVTEGIRRDPRGRSEVPMNQNVVASLAGVARKTIFPAGPLLDELEALGVTRSPGRAMGLVQHPSGRFDQEADTWSLNVVPGCPTMHSACSYLDHPALTDVSDDVWTPAHSAATGDQRLLSLLVDPKVEAWNAQYDRRGEDHAYALALTLKHLAPERAVVLSTRLAMDLMSWPRQTAKNAVRYLVRILLLPDGPGKTQVWHLPTMCRMEVQRDRLDGPHIDWPWRNYRPADSEQPRNSKPHKDGVLGGYRIKGREADEARARANGWIPDITHEEIEAFLAAERLPTYNPRW